MGVSGTLLALVAALALVSNVAVSERSENYGKNYFEWVQTWAKIRVDLEDDESLRADMEEHLNRWVQFPDVDPVPPFTCQIEVSPANPTSVHELRPSDIKIVAAFGDSITAGNGLGAQNLPAVAIENRGESWCIGTDFTYEKNVLTLPNILRHFNPDLMGASSCYATVNSRHSWNNVAEPGGDARDMPQQAELMIGRIKNDSRFDWQTDWKMATLFIGGNDLCGYCKDPSRTPEDYRNRIEEALDLLHADLPRMLVNLVPIFDVSPIHNMTKEDPVHERICDYLHEHFCYCAYNDTLRPAVRREQLAYFDRLKELVDSGRYDTHDGFTVVLQPHLRDIQPVTNENGTIDMTFFSPDCFHPSRKSHHAFAYMLWNVMLMPVEEKPLVYNTSEIEGPHIKCPTPERPYIFTNKNSPVPLKSADSDKKD